MHLNATPTRKITATQMDVKQAFDLRCRTRRKQSQSIMFLDTGGNQEAINHPGQRSTS